MKLAKALINDRLHVSKISCKFRIPTICNFAVIYLRLKFVFFSKKVDSIVFFVDKQNFTVQ